MSSPMVFDIQGFTYLGDDVGFDEREYSRNRYEQNCPICRKARKESIISYEDPYGSLYSCFGCKVLWGHEDLIWDFQVPTPEEIERRKLSDPWKTRA